MNTDSLAQAQSVARNVIGNVTADQLGDSTPCTKWTVGELVDHMVGAQFWGLFGIQGAEMTETGEGSSKGDFVAAFDSAATNTLAAFGEDGALERTVNLGFGDMPGAALMGLVTTDTFTHSWDLARATGQSTDLDPGLAAELLARSRQSIRDEYRTEDGSMFGLEQTAPEGSTTADELAAFLGRSV